MAGRFSYSRPKRRGATDPWFRFGEFDVGSAGFLALLCAVSILIYGFEPRDKPILRRLVLVPDDVLGGQVWRVVTWPLANGFDQSLLWTAVSVAMLWYFGGRLEDQIGRVRMTILIAAMIVLPGVIGTLLDLPQAGVRSLAIGLLLIYIAEYPHTPFFFGIPAWILGIVYVATDSAGYTMGADGHPTDVLDDATFVGQRGAFELRMKPRSVRMLALRRT